MRSRAAVLWNKMVDGLTVKKILLILLGAMICSFGIHNIHQRTNITEGGVMLGYCDRGSTRIAMKPARTMRIDKTAAKIGRRMQN